MLISTVPTHMIDSPLECGRGLQNLGYNDLFHCIICNILENDSIQQKCR